jgi:hypothetical protein
MVGVAEGPKKSDIKGSKPPAGITCPAAFVPPPNPHVWNVTVLADVSEKVVSKTLTGVARVPVKLNAEPLAATGAKADVRSRHIPIPATDLPCPTNENTPVKTCNLEPSRECQ